MIIDVYNNEIVLQSKDRLLAIENMCSYKDPDSVHRKRYLIKKYTEEGNTRGLDWVRKWDGRNRVYRIKEEKIVDHLWYVYTVPIGLYHIVMAYLKIKEDYDFTDHRFITQDNLLTNDDIQQYVKLRDNQREAGRRIKEVNARGIVEATTGFGKTILGIYSIQHHLSPTVIFADKSVIIDLWVKDLQNFFNIYTYKIGGLYVFSRIEHKKKKDALQDYKNILFMVGTPKIFYNVYFKRSGDTKERNELIKQWLKTICNSFIYDEVHHAGSPTSVSVLDELTTYYRMGFSATVMKRDDNRDLEYIARIGSIIYTLSSRDIHEKRSIDLQFLKTHSIPFGRREDYTTIYNEAVITNDSRNDIIVDTIYDMLEENRIILVLVDKLDHGAILHSMTGFNYTWSKDKERERKFEEFTSGKESVLICTYQLAGEGFNYPMLDTVILAGAGRSAIKLIQAIGRAMRVVEGKNKPKIFDFADNCEKLRDQTLERLNVWVKEQIFKINVKDTFLSRYMR